MKEIEKLQYDNRKLWDDLNISESNKERIQEIYKMIPKDVTSIADLGCGNGLFLNHIKKNSNIKDLIGIDFSELAIKEVKTKKMVGDITKVSLKDSSYDMVCALEVLEHLNIGDFKKTKDELSRVSNKYILISVPFDEDLEIEFFKCPICKSKYNTSHHKRSFKKDDIEDLFSENGFTFLKSKYISKRNQYFVLSNLLNIYRKVKGVKRSSGMVCPVCGYMNSSLEKSKKEEKKKGSIFSILKRVWPKRYKYKWIAAIYIKKN